jgi:hypothetical protein
MATEEHRAGLPQLSLTFDDCARPGPLIRRGTLAETGPNDRLTHTRTGPASESPRPARFRTSARDPRRITKQRDIKPVLVKAPPPAVQVWWNTTTGRSISRPRAGRGCGPMLESLSPAASATVTPPHQASSIPEPERLRRLPSFSRAPSWGAELKGAAAPRPTHAYLAYFTRIPSAEMAA